MEETISLKEIYETLKKRLGLIISITLLAVAASAIISYFMLTPRYETTTQVLVSEAATASSILDSASFGSDSEYIDTYNVILQSPYILDQVEEELGLENTPEINVQREGDSQVVNISVEDTNPARATDIANATAGIFEQEMPNLLNVDNIYVLASADLGEQPTPVSPNPPLNMAIAFVVGLMTAVGLAFLLEFLDQSLRNEQDVEDTLGLPILGSVSVIDEETPEVKTSKSEVANTELSRSNRKGRESA
ncbi:YveK family protein [Texcoconibacillus texcoconensis]|uniref:Capsular polysaccharide biosynthesis protein n=1 Tax=Texcoconibacillus texcoconensis TaxID=1095777 RepID=A0A840QSS7_9BACI|nr:Wzz/FepE/Etk N-terminal domain-containing protein [Texcoconibacillus texcoconensis]MBB5174572.1 capsular polysaccharide biosynthesis protein [Texcoconibacillus texcoconensis]